MIAAVINDGTALEHVDDKFKADKEIVETAISSDGYVLEYANKKFKKDKVIVLKALETSNLSNFNDIDKSLADAKMIYTNLSNIKELEKWGVSEWSLSEKELTSLQHNYLDFSENMYKWYKEFRNN